MVCGGRVDKDQEKNGGIEATCRFERRKRGRKEPGGGGKMGSEWVWRGGAAYCRD